MNPKNALAMLNFIAELYIAIKTPEPTQNVETADNGKVPTKVVKEEVKA